MRMAIQIDLLIGHCIKSLSDVILEHSFHSCVELSNNFWKGLRLCIFFS